MLALRTCLPATTARQNVYRAPPRVFGEEYRGRNISTVVATMGCPCVMCTNASTSVTRDREMHTSGECPADTCHRRQLVTRLYEASSLCRVTGFLATAARIECKKSSTSCVCTKAGTSRNACFAKKTEYVYRQLYSPRHTVPVVARSGP